MSIIRDDEPPLFKSSDLNYIKRKIQEAEDFKKPEVVRTQIKSLDRLIQQKQLSIAMRL